MAGLFSTPQIQAPQPLPAPPSPTSSDPAVAKATQDSMAAADRTAQISAQGKARNILTGPNGLSTEDDLQNIDRKMASGV